MRIMLITAAMDAGGVETHIFCLARELHRMGDEVYVVSSGGRLARRLSEEGIEHISLCVDRSSPISVIWGRRKLCQIIADNGIELIHAHSRISAFLVHPLAKRYGIPFLTTAHARFSTPPIYKRLSRWGNRTIAVSEDLGQYLRDSYCVDGENIRVIPNGIDTSVFYADDGARRKNRIVFMSRLDKDCSSGALALCHIGAELYRSFPDIEIVICGGGEMLEKVKERAERACAEARARFIFVRGHVEDTASELRAAKVFVGVSRAALEALGCGALTVLCGDEGALGFLDTEDKLRRAELTNFCCRGEEKLDDRLLFGEIKRALSLSEDRAMKISRMGAEYVKELHGHKKMATRTRLLYEEAESLGKGRGRVVLCGYYGYGNMGDNALLRASIKRAKAAFEDLEISALTANGKKDESRFGVRCVKRMNPIAVVSELWNAQTLVLGGGTLLQDRTSLRSLAYYASVCGIASFRGVGIELWGNGLSEPRSVIAERLMSSVLESARYIGLRDMLSVTEALRIISPECADRLYLEQDLACGQAPAAPERVEYLQKRLGLFKGDSLASYAVIAVKGSEGEGFIKILKKELLELLSDGVSLVFLPMFPKEDGALCHSLAKELGGRVAEGVSESDAVGLMKNALIVCGMRLHALVFASAAGVPFMGLGSDPKIEGFCRENGGLFFTDRL